MAGIAIAAEELSDDEHEQEQEQPGGANRSVDEHGEVGHIICPETGEDDEAGTRQRRSRALR